jgi:hypothetical protein
MVMKPSFSGPGYRIHGWVLDPAATCSAHELTHRTFQQARALKKREEVRGKAITANRRGWRQQPAKLHASGREELSAVPGLTHYSGLPAIRMKCAAKSKIGKA